jgi:hypothetical protein
MAAIKIDYGTVQVFDDAVPADIFKEIADAAPRLTWQWGWRSQLPQARYWHHELLRGGVKSNTEDRTDSIREHPIAGFAHYIDWLRSDVVPSETKLLRYYLNSHTFGTDGSPHTDSERDDELTLVLFINTSWRAEYGGETVVFDAAGEIDKAVMPRANRLMTFPSNRVHAPRPLSKLFLGLRVVLVAKLGAAEGKGFVRCK